MSKERQRKRKQKSRSLGAKGKQSEGRITYRDPSDVFMDDYERASGKAAAAELWCRLLLNKRDETKIESFGRYYVNVMNGLIKHYDHELSEQEKGLIVRSIELRNKLLHSEMMELAGLSIRPQAPVKKITLASDDPEKIVATIIAAADGTINTPLVSEGAGDKDGILGWFFQNGVSGVFHECYEVFSNVLKIVSRLAHKY